MSNPNLDADRFFRLFTASERDIRAYLFSLLPDRTAVDDVMQETSAVLWKKFDQLQADDEFLRWAIVVARYEALAFGRRVARDRHVFDEVLMQKVADDYIEAGESAKEVIGALDICLERLAEADRQLLLHVYGAGMKIRALAEKLHRTEDALYKSISRLRRALAECVKFRVAEARTDDCR